MEQTFQEFRQQVRKSTKGKQFKIRNSWGVRNAFDHIRKNGWYNIGRPLKHHEFYSIIRMVNDLLAEEVANGKTIKFPCRMGRLELRKYARGAKIVDGKLRVTYVPDWDSTLKLWYEDEEARREKIILRHEQPYLFKVKYDKYNATYENKSFYDFALTANIKKALKENIKQRKVDTLW